MPAFRAGLLGCEGFTRLPSLAPQGFSHRKQERGTIRDVQGTSALLRRRPPGLHTHGDLGARLNLRPALAGIVSSFSEPVLLLLTGALAISHLLSA